MRRPAHSTIAAYLALFLALGATAWAAATVGSGDVVNNSLKSVDLKNNGVMSPDVGNGTLGGRDVGNGSLRAGDFRPNAIGGADADESSLAVSRITQALGGQINQQITGPLAFRLMPNNTFTQQPTESDQLLPSAQVTFPATCTSPRSAFIYLLVDDPTLSATSIIGLAQVPDSGVGAVTKTAAFTPAPFSSGLALFRTGAPTPHSFFVHAAGSCSSGAGVTLDSVDVRVVGNR